jgi:hypothetical protein
MGIDGKCDTCGFECDATEGYENGEECDCGEGIIRDYATIDLVSKVKEVRGIINNELDKWAGYDDSSIFESFYKIDEILKSSLNKK